MAINGMKKYKTRGDCDLAGLVEVTFSEVVYVYEMR